MSVEHQVHRALQQAVSYWLVTGSDVTQGDLKMTEAELWHMHLLAGENTFIGMENVATIIFAYLAAAYFVGGKLSRFQAALATVFFVFVASVFSALR